MMPGLFFCKLVVCSPPPKTLDKNSQILDETSFFSCYRIFIEAEVPESLSDIALKGAEYRETCIAYFYCCIGNYCRG